MEFFKTLNPTTKKIFQESTFEDTMVGFTPGKWECVEHAMIKGDNPVLFDEDSGLGMGKDTDTLTRRSLFLEDDDDFCDLDGSFSELHTKNPLCRKGLKRFRSFDVRRSLFSSKRSAADQIEVETTPITKRFRDISIEEDLSQTSFPAPSSTNATDIIEAVDKLTSGGDLIADGSRASSLPTIPGKHSDLKAITPDTMKDVLEGQYSDQMDKVTVIDCRYPYEYEGGHIQGAINLYTKDAVDAFLRQYVATPTSERHVLIFHCEFSSERGPKMYRFLRAQDREMNKNQYPRLHFPEIYLLEGGYKAFYYQHQEQCHPKSYKPMLHKEHSKDLRHFRAKSKSWTAGEKPQRRGDNRLRLSF